MDQYLTIIHSANIIKVAYRLRRGGQYILCTIFCISGSIGVTDCNNTIGPNDVSNTSSTYPGPTYLTQKFIY